MEQDTSERTASEGGAARKAAVNVQHLDAEPLSEALSQLHPTNRERLVEFISTVPNPLPNQLAHPQAVFFDPRLPLSRNTLIVDPTDGHVIKEIAIANPGSNDRQTNVICLRNGEQTGCTREVDVWSVSLPAQTFAFVPVYILAAPGDMLTFLFIPDRESERFDPASSMLWLFVSQEPPSPSKYAEVPAHEKVYDGCDFALLQPTLDATDSIRIPGTQKRGTRLYLIFQTCEPVVEELVQLIPIADRSRVVNLPEDVWQMPVRLAYPATVIAIDTQLFDNIEEFQVAVVPVGESAQRVPDWWGWLPFTHAISFTD